MSRRSVVGGDIILTTQAIVTILNCVEEHKDGGLTLRKVVEATIASRLTIDLLSFVRAS